MKRHLGYFLFCLLPTALLAQTNPCQDNGDYVRLYNQATDQYKQGQYAAAAVSFDKAGRICPDCIDCAALRVDCMSKMPAPTAKLRPIRIGKHALTLQWISWDKPGSVIISKKAPDFYTIEGSQKSKEAYLLIEGTLKKVSETELVFDGKITSLVPYLNSGKPCVRQGKKLFLITQNRKYWRLQDMLNCGGDGTDYVDIYF